MNVKMPSEVPVIRETEVVVAGGGPGGIGAAVAAARQGRRTLLIEHYGFLGGMSTAGEVFPFMRNHLGDESLDQGIYTEWLQRMANGGGAKGRLFDSKVARLTAEEMCLEAGVDLLYHHRTAHVEREREGIGALVLHSKSGFSAVVGKVYVDATGDGDVAALAGAPFEMGGETGPNVQPMTLCFKLRLNPEAAGSNPRQHYDWGTKGRELLQEIYREFKAAGKTTNQREDILVFSTLDPYVAHFNSTRVIGRNATSGTDLSAAEIEGRQQMRELIHMLSERAPAFKHCTIESMAVQIGVRETRRVRGKAYLTRADYMNQVKFPDGIARVNYPIDIHSTGGAGTEMTHLPDGAWYEIPYGCIVPNRVDNLLMGCRAISVDHAVHASMRVMPPVISLGQAAGTAAAMACEKGCAPAELNGIELVERLKRQGRNLGTTPSGAS